MGQDAECYQKTVNDRVIILNPRAYYTQSFLAPDWTDLRVGFFLSLTDKTNDDLTFGASGAPGDLHETISNPGVLPTSDRYFLGVADMNPGGMFGGFTNLAFGTPDRTGDSTLVASDAGVGTGTAFWRPGNSSNNKHSAGIINGGMKVTAITDNLQHHFPQDAGTVAAGYAVLLGLQFLRDNATSKNLTMRIKSTTHSADMLFSNTPTKELIHSSLDPWPASVQLGPVVVKDVPNSFYFYWGFHNSRLRVHSLGLLRMA